MPADHPRRVELNDEVHARPPEVLPTPCRITFLALKSDDGARDREREHVRALANRFGLPGPAGAADRYSANLGPLRLKWERHTEYSRYMFIVGSGGEDPFAASLGALPADWPAALPGQVLVAGRVALLPAPTQPPDYEAVSARHFDGNVPVGGAIAGGGGIALTDFRIHADGYSRLMVLNAHMSPRQAGRMVQRLLEIETYRMLALLALPLARRLTPFVADCERELAAVTAALVDSRGQEEAQLLDRLIRLEAEIERLGAESHYRFSASRAYHELVTRRIAELREERIQGLQTFREFTERRLAPAMNTCDAVASRLESLSGRVARTTQLLSTRVDITREQQNAAVLESMNRRAQLQLRLQETVEGLSVAAITYYIVGLVGYVAKGLKAGGVGVDPEVTTAVAIPVVAIAVAFGVRQIRRRITRGSAESGSTSAEPAGEPWRS
jgi:uncharacterized membrane-anchored protein